MMHLLDWTGALCELTCELVSVSAFAFAAAAAAPLLRANNRR